HVVRRVKHKGWYLTDDSGSPEGGHQSLPPMLSIMLDVPIPSCSEASRGLSVLPQGGGIFTDIAISPGPSLRQFPSRDAIRAGLNFMFLNPLFRDGIDYTFFLSISVMRCFMECFLLVDTPMR